MSKQVQLPLEQCDLSRFFDSSVFNRSIKLWVNQSCFTCSKLILAQHSSIFEQHLRDSPPSVLLEDFNNIPGAETAIRDGLIFLYGGVMTISMSNIKVLTKFATIYNIRKLMVVCMQYIEEYLTVETVMKFFVILKTIDDDGYPVVPEIIRKFMENHTGPIVDHILKSAENIDDEFLLALLELPSSSILVQRCLKAGILPDPIVDLIFKHSDTINVNFLLHDDKRTYVRLITILKTKARSYQDMEKIIDIQQKCISKMCHPYGSVDSLANPLTPAPSVSHMQNKNTSIPEDRKSNVRVTYQPRSFESKLLPLTDGYEDEYMLPEELKSVQEKRHNMDVDNRLSEKGPPFRRYDRDVTPHHVPEKSFTTRDNNNFPQSRSNSVSNKVKNLERTFVAKYPGDEMPSRNEFLQPKTENNNNSYSGNDTATEHSDVEVTSNKIKSLRLSKRDNPVNKGDYNKTNYAQVYSKKVQERDKEKEEKSLNSYESQTRELMDQQKDITAALNKLASQQAIIEHTYDNMSAASSRNLQPPSRSTNESSSARVSRNPSTHASRRRSNSSHGPRIKHSQSGEDEPRENHAPTTFYAANSKPPPLPMNPPPSESFFTKGGKEIGPPSKSNETRSPTLADKRSMELLESNLDNGFLPPGILPEHDRPLLPHSRDIPTRDIEAREFPARDIPMSPREILSPREIMSPAGTVKLVYVLKVGMFTC